MSRWHSRNESENDDSVVIARSSKTIIVLVGLLSIPALWRAIVSPTRWSILWLLGFVAVVVRVAQLCVSVSSSGVLVRNFFRTTHVPLWEAEIEVRTGEQTPLLSDAGGKLDSEGRVLYIKRTWSDRDDLHVGVCPRFGDEFDRIHRELVDAIRHHRAA